MGCETLIPNINTCGQGSIPSLSFPVTCTNTVIQRCNSCVNPINYLALQDLIKSAQTIRKTSSKRLNSDKCLYRFSKPAVVKYYIDLRHLHPPRPHNLYVVQGQNALAVCRNAYLSNFYANFQRSNYLLYYYFEHKF